MLETTLANWIQVFLPHRMSILSNCTACRSKGASEQARGDEDYEQREHNREAAGVGLEEKARQQRLILEKVRQLPKVWQAG